MQCSTNYAPRLAWPYSPKSGNLTGILPKLAFRHGRTLEFGKHIGPLSADSLRALIGNNARRTGSDFLSIATMGPLLPRPWKP